MTAETENNNTSGIVFATESDEFFAVELHHHLIGAVRPQIIFDAAKRKSQLPAGVETLADFLPYVTAPTKGENLLAFLKIIFFYLPLLANDTQAIAELAMDFCEQQYNSRIYYTETRITPYELIGDNVSYDDVMQTLLDGLAKGCLKYGIKVRLLLSVLCEWTGDADERSIKTLELMQKYRYHPDTQLCGVVGIDIAGNEAERIAQNKVFDKTFEMAKNLGFHRSVHAGEGGGASSVKHAITNMCAERIGHGYRAVEDQSVMDMILDFNQQNATTVVPGTNVPNVNKENMSGSARQDFVSLPMIHFECCPISSVCTNAVAQYKRSDAKWLEHPLTVFKKQGMHFSISTDDPQVFQCDMNEEIEVCKSKMEFTYKEIGDCFIRAMEAAYIDDPIEKRECIALIKKRVQIWLQKHKTQSK